MPARLSSLRRFASAHPRWIGRRPVRALRDLLRIRRWAVRGSFHDAADDLRNANLVLFALGCVAVAAYYLLFVLGWMRILADWDIHLSYPAALRAEMVSMLAKYIPGGVWTPAARVVAARRAGVTDGALVTASMLLEAGISAVAGVIVFVVSLAWVKGVDAPIAPLVAFGVVVAVLLHPRVFRPLASRVLRAASAIDDLPPLRGATMLILLVFYSVHVDRRRRRAVAPAAVGRRASRCPRRSSSSAASAPSARSSRCSSFFAPSGLGPREASMYGLMLAVAGRGRRSAPPC